MDASTLPWTGTFCSVLGERTPGEEVQEADIISAVEFDRHGEHLATGDRGGRVVLFQRVASKEAVQNPDVRTVARRPLYEYRYLTEFQSHEPEFDYLKSLEIEEKINKVRWANHECQSHLLLSTNDKTIKLWKVYEKKVANLASFNCSDQDDWSITAVSRPWQNGHAPAWSRKESLLAGKVPLALKIPQITGVECHLASRCRRLYLNGHAYHINSISCASDAATFISADDLRINLWHMDVSSQAFNIVDNKPSNMEDLTEVITCTEFHPHHCYLFGYSSSKGSIRLGDLRSSALCDSHTKLFEDPELQGSKSFFSEIISSISDLHFTRDGRYMLSRDYMSLKLWDLAMESAPVATYAINDTLRNKLCDLYENDCIFDKFDCTMSKNHQYVASGSYGNCIRVTSTKTGASIVLEATRDPMNKRLQATKGTSRFGLGRSQRSSISENTMPVQPMDFASKLLHLAWHPEVNIIAAAASNSLYMYYAPASF
eukprot:jgi/Botrbrau1/14670/Bobra.0108s0028.1